jgi:hypothetical protein
LQVRVLPGASGFLTVQAAVQPTILLSGCCIMKHVMRTGFRVGMMALGLMAQAAYAKSPHRLVVVVAWPDDPRAREQHAALDRGAALLRERDVVVQDITPEAAQRELPGVGVNSQASFEVLVVGKDGGIKLRHDKPVAVSEITALIDTMPMRRDEMKR